MKKDTSFNDIYCTRKEYYTTKVQRKNNGSQRGIATNEIKVALEENTINDCQPVLRTMDLSPKSLYGLRRMRDALRDK